MRGRKSAAALGVVAVDGGTSRLKPPASLSEAERKVFVDLVSFVDCVAVEVLAVAALLDVEATRWQHHDDA